MGLERGDDGGIDGGAFPEAGDEENVRGGHGCHWTGDVEVDN